MYLNDTRGYDGFSKNIINLNTGIPENKILCMFSIIIRILLFLDQLHDFNENADRNELYSKCNIKNFGKKRIHDEIKELCKDDISYIYSQFGYSSDNFEGIKITKNEFVEYYKKILEYASNSSHTKTLEGDSSKLKYEFIIKERENKDKQKYYTGILPLCGLIKHNRFSNEKKFTCVDNHKYLPNDILLYNYYNNNEKVELSNLNIYIDAGKSKYNSSMISNFVCDILKTRTYWNLENLCNKFRGLCSRKLYMSNVKTIVYENTHASHFDSSFSSGLQILIEDFEKLNKDKKETLTINKDPIEESFNIKLCVKRDAGEQDIELINLTYNKVTRSKAVSYIKKDTDDKYTINTTNENLKKIIELIKPKENLDKPIKKSKKKPIKNPIKKSTNKEMKDYIEHILNNSDKKYDFLVYDNYSIDQLGKFNPEYSLKIDRFFANDSFPYKVSSQCSVRHISEEIVSKQNFKLMYYKTLGDFGQILTTYIKSEQNRKFTYFYTFDRICSYISAIFNYGTIFENDKTPVFPLDIYIPNMIQDVEMNQFGKSKSKKLKKSKKKNKISLELKRLQKKAKKKKIRITKIVRGKRRYKTVKELKKILIK